MERAPVHNLEDCLAHESEAGQIARGVNWTATPLGPAARWSSGLKAAVASCLGSRWPTVIMWGPELICLYNDAYSEIIMQKHPRAMGLPAREVFAELWEDVEPFIEQARFSGDAMRYADQRLEIERRGFLEEAYFTFSVTPVKNTNGVVEGLVLPVHETTPKVLSRRRLKTLRDLLGAAKEGEAPEEVCQWAARALRENPGDIPYALIYLNEGASSGLMAAAGVPLRIIEQIGKTPLDTAKLQRQAESRNSGELLRIESILPMAAGSKGWLGWDYRSVVIPLVTVEPPQPSGYLVAGLSPLLRFDDEYRDFLELIGGQLGRMIAGGRAVEEAQIIEGLLRFDRLSGPNLDRIIGTLTSEAQGLCNADFAAFFAIGEGGPEDAALSASVVTGTAPVGWERMMAGFLAAVGGRGRNPGRNRRKYTAPQERTHSWLIMPVTSASGWFHGSLVLGREETNKFGPRHERLLTGLLAHGSIAIDNAKLLIMERTAHQSLDRALAIRNNFLSVATHELRNPLNSLNLRLNILKREINSLTDTENEGKELDGHVEKAAAQIRRMSQLLDRLLDIARIASGRLRLEPREYDIAEQIRQVAGRFSGPAESGQLQVAAVSPVQGRWDQARAEQVISNLISNAIKYGEGKPIRVSLRASEDAVEVEVADHGRGIRAEDQDHVFEQFERVESDEARGGFGLGLWISRQIVHAMGGEVSLQSQPGEGATFVVWLPRGKKAQNQGKQETNK